MSELKICKDCMHCLVLGGGDFTCLFKSISSTNLVSGNIQHIGVKSCDTSRADENMCGIEGKWHNKAKES